METKTQLLPQRLIILDGIFIPLKEHITLLGPEFDSASNYSYNLWAWCLFLGRRLQLPYLFNEGNRLSQRFSNLGAYKFMWDIVKNTDAQALKVLIKYI